MLKGDLNKKRVHNWLKKYSRYKYYSNSKYDNPSFKRGTKNCSDWEDIK